ncbi:hypothetical protein HQ590_00785 [bacterium]|nr:hypothetical protein [bacterium]
MPHRLLPRLAALAVVLVLCSTSCNKPPVAQAVDPRPFEAAIIDYLDRQQFGMKIAKLERIDLQSDAGTATVVCRMQEAEETYALTVTWTFSLRRREDGGWQVTTHRAK